MINTDRILLTPVLTDGGSTEPGDARIVIEGETSIEVGDAATLTARVEGLAELYTTADYVRWAVESQEPSGGGSGRVIAIVPDGLSVRVTAVNPGRAVLKAMSTVTGAVVETVEVTVTGEVVVPPTIEGLTITGERLVGTPLTAEFELIRGSKEADPEQFEYVWHRSGTPIEGATGRSYIATEDDLNREIRVRVTPIDVEGHRGPSEESLPVFVTMPEPSPTTDPSPAPTSSPSPSTDPSPTPTSSPSPTPTSSPNPSTGPNPTPTSSPSPTPSPTLAPSPSPGPSESPEEEPFPGFKSDEVAVSANGVGLNKRAGVAFISGYPDNTFQPERKVSREEALTMLFNLVVNPDKHEVDVAGNPYRDVRADAYSLPAILYFTNKGLVSGTGHSSFAPGKAMTRAEFARLLSSFLPDNAEHDAAGFTDTEEHWASDDIRKAAATGLMIGYEDGTFRPDQELTRAQIVTVLCRLLGRTAIGGGGGESGASPFPDVPPAHWAFDYIVEASGQ